MATDLKKNGQKIASVIFNSNGTIVRFFNLSGSEVGNIVKDGMQTTGSTRYIVRDKSNKKLAGLLFKGNQIEILSPSNSVIEKINSSADICNIDFLSLVFQRFFAMI